MGTHYEKMQNVLLVTIGMSIIFISPMPDLEKYYQKKYLVDNNKHDKSIKSLLYWMHKHVCSASFTLPVTYSSLYIIACYYPCCTEYLGSENVCFKQHKHLSFKRCPFEHSIKPHSPYFRKQSYYC